LVNEYFLDFELLNQFKKIDEFAMNLLLSSQVVREKKRKETFDVRAPNMNESHIQYTS
jgi:hypothetical protein